MKFRHIGDVILSTPLITNLHALYPNAQIDYALNIEGKVILEHNPYIHTIFPYERSLIKKHNRLIQLFLEYQYAKEILKNRYDIVINLTEGDRGAQIALLSQGAKKFGIKPKKGILSILNIFDRYLKLNEPLHTVEKDLRFLTFLNKQPLSKKVELYWPKKSEKEINRILNEFAIEKFVVLHPAAQHHFKCWDSRKFAKVIDYLQEKRKISVIMTAGSTPQEKKIVEEILAQTVTQPLDLSGKINLQELSYLYSKAKLYLGIDTAPMHIAAAVNTRVFALFGPTEAIEWGPWDNDIQINNYIDAYASQQNGKHFVMQADKEAYYIYKANKKLPPPKMELHENEVIKILDTYEF